MCVFLLQVVTGGLKSIWRKNKTGYVCVIVLILNNILFIISDIIPASSIIAYIDFYYFNIMHNNVCSKCKQ